MSLPREAWRTRSMISNPAAAISLPRKRNATWHFADELHSPAMRRGLSGTIICYQ
jgi:hypothetical protein